MTDLSAAEAWHESADYDMARTLDVGEPAQLKALADPTRSAILALLSERAATSKQLATALGKPPGTVGHHVGVLAANGLVRVVRTRKVRAITAKYYGRTAATFILRTPLDGQPREAFVAKADAIAREMHIDPDNDPDLKTVDTVRYARIPIDRVEEWIERLTDFGAEFATQPAAGDHVWGIWVALFPTTRRALPPDEPDQPDQPEES